MLPIRCLTVCLTLIIRSNTHPNLLEENDTNLSSTGVKEYIKPFEDLHEAEGTDNKGSYYLAENVKKKKGYENFDSYHKKDGDVWGHEAHFDKGGKKNDKSGSFFTGGNRNDRAYLTDTEDFYDEHHYEEDDHGDFSDGEYESNMSEYDYEENNHNLGSHPGSSYLPVMQSHYGPRWTTSYFVRHY